MATRIIWPFCPDMESPPFSHRICGKGRGRAWIRRTASKRHRTAAECRRRSTGSEGIRGGSRSDGTGAAAVGSHSVSYRQPPKQKSQKGGTLHRIEQEVNRHMNRHRQIGYIGRRHCGQPGFSPQQDWNHPRQAPVPEPVRPKIPEPLPVYRAEPQYRINSAEARLVRF